MQQQPPRPRKRTDWRVGCVFPILVGAGLLIVGLAIGMRLQPDTASRQVVVNVVDRGTVIASTSVPAR